VVWWRQQIAKAVLNRSRSAERFFIDPSGIDGALGCVQPKIRGYENDMNGSKDTIFVCMETWEDVEERQISGINDFVNYQG